METTILTLEQLENLIQTIKDGDLHQFNFGEDADEETGEIESVFGAKALSMFDGRYLFVGYYGGGTNWTFSLDDMEVSEIAFLLHNEFNGFMFLELDELTEPYL